MKDKPESVHSKVLPKLLGSASARVFARSGVLGTLGWVAFGLLAVVVALAIAQSATWLLVVFTVLAVISILVFLALYVYLAPRSE